MKRLFLVILLAALVIGGYYARQALQRPSVQPPAPVPSPAPPPTQRTVTVYFMDSDALYLVGVQRRVRADNVLKGIVDELIAGPTEPGLFPTIPSGTRLLGVRHEGNTVTVDFSREFKDNHGGGTTGETFTLQSLAHSLTQVEGVAQVQILVEGQQLDSLAGHIDLRAPVKPNPAMLKK